MSAIRILAIVALLAAPSLPQIANGPTGSLVLNGVDGAPAHVTVVPGGDLTIDIAGNPNRPFLLAMATDLEIGSQVFAPNAIDIGPASSLAVVMNGLSQSSLLNLLANTGPGGLQSMSFPVPVSAPLGLVAALQAFIVDPSLPGFVKATAASRLVVRHHPDIAWLEEPVVGGDDRVVVAAAGTAPAVPAGLGAIELLTIGLQRFGEMTALEVSAPSLDAPGSWDRLLPPSPVAPRYFGSSPHAPFIRTVHGDLLAFRDLASGLDGFVRAGDAGVAPIAASLQAPVAGGRAWKRLVNVNGAVLAAVEIGGGLGGGGDRLRLLRIDGAPFPATQALDHDVTPASVHGFPITTIHDESLTFVNNVLYFVADTTAATGLLMRCRTDGTTVASPVAPANVQVSPTVVTGVSVSPEIRFHGGIPNRLFLHVTDVTGTVRAVQTLTNVTPSSQTVSLVRTVPSLSPFGRFSDGQTARFAASPTSMRVAFQSRVGPVDELFVCALSGAALQQVTSSARFASAIQAVAEPVWIDDDDLLFWAGTAATAMDLYRFRASTGDLVNVTLTNGQSGATTIAATPLATLEPSGQIRMADRLLARRVTHGTILGVPVVTGVNLMGVPFANLAPYDITGGAFGGGAPNAFLGLPVLSRDGSRFWVRDNGNAVSASRLLSFTPGSAAAATIEVAGSFPLAGVGTAFAPSDDGTRCLALRSTGNGSEVVEATAGVGVTTVVPAAGSAVTWVDRFPAAAPHDGLVFTTVDSGGNRHLHAQDRVVGSTFLVAPLPVSGRFQILAQPLF